jgi:hypothetical protein
MNVGRGCNPSASLWSQSIACRLRSRRVANPSHIHPVWLRIPETAEKIDVTMQ